MVPLLLGVTLLIQFFHWVEHVAQVYQHWWLGYPIAASSGILFFLDLEWNHLIFNSAYLVLLVAIFLFGRKAFSTSQGATNVYLAGVGIQAYHTFEHVIRIWQYLTANCTPCKGILGWYFDGVYLHFAFNTVVLLFPLIAFVLLGFHRYLSRLPGLLTVPRAKES